jgi:hypothetical protein
MKKTGGRKSLDRVPLKKEMTLKELSNDNLQYMVQKMYQTIGYDLPLIRRIFFKKLMDLRSLNFKNVFLRLNNL